ncbi:MAG: ATP-binding protein [Polyangiales bacterium]
MGDPDLRLGAARRYGLGLRAQTLLALTAAFVLAFGGLSVVVVQAAQTSHALEQARRSRALVDASARALPADDHARAEAVARLIGHAGVMGARLASSDGASQDFGQLGPTRAGAARRLDDGALLTLWTDPDAPEQASPLGRLLRLYLIVTGALILALVYVLLTRLIVRPVENLTASVERLRAPGSARTPSDPPIAMGGAAELVQLSVAFSRMARELREDKRALETRLRELEETARALRATQDQLIRSEKLAGVGRLAAGVAHEIGNPLAAILGFVQLLQLGGLPEAEARDFLARIRSETERIHHIIRDLLGYARLPPSEGAAVETADLARVADEAVALVAPQKDLRRITLERRVHGERFDVRGSAHELTQIALNLLLNAADAVGGEGHILVELTREGDTCALGVSDSGPGIAEEIRAHLFEPFATTKPQGQGTGLGLAVCHAIVARLGGSIEGENLPHRGARFTVRLPSALQ